MTISHLTELRNIVFGPAASTLSAPIIVVGMHRSGTSLMSRILTQLNVYMGEVLDPNHESAAFKEINKALLGTVGGNWTRPYPFADRIKDDRFLKDVVERLPSLMTQWNDLYGAFDASKPWGWKDPRNSLTLPVWLAIFPNAKIITMIRNGIDVALSLSRREPRRYLHRTDVPRLFPPTIMQGYRLWEQYSITIKQYANLCPDAKWLTIYYEDLIQQPLAQIQNLAAFLELDAPMDKLEEIAHVFIKKPTSMSIWERRRLTWLFKFKILNEDILESYYGRGYLSRRLA